MIKKCRKQTPFYESRLERNNILKGSGHWSNSKCNFKRMQRKPKREPQSRRVLKKKYSRKTECIIMCLPKLFPICTRKSSVDAAAETINDSPWLTSSLTDGRCKDDCAFSSLRCSILHVALLQVSRPLFFVFYSVYAMVNVANFW